MHNDIASHTAPPGWSPYPRNHDVAVKFDIKHVATRHDICKHTWNYNTRVWENIASKHTWQFRHQQKHASMLVQLLHSLLHLRRRTWNWYLSIFLASACQKTVNTTNRDGKRKITSHLNSRAISCVWKPFPHVAIGPLCGHHDGHLAYIITTNMLTRRQWCSTALCLLREVRPHEQFAVLCDHETASDDAAM